MNIWLNSCIWTLAKAFSVLSELSSSQFVLMFFLTFLLAFIWLFWTVLHKLICINLSPANCGAVLSLEEVEGSMKGMKLGSESQVRKVPAPQRGNGTPFMAEHLEEALTGGSCTRPHSRDSDMSAFNKLVSSMKASGTLPTHPKTNTNNVSILAIYFYLNWPDLYWITTNSLHAALKLVTSYKSVPVWYCMQAC